jgi:hypothetical protein
LAIVGCPEHYGSSDLFSAEPHKQKTGQAAFKPRQPGKTRASYPARHRGLFIFDFLEVGINHIVFR